jgi:hypothetical protein
MEQQTKPWAVGLVSSLFRYANCLLRRLFFCYKVMPHLKLSVIILIINTITRKIFLT